MASQSRSKEGWQLEDSGPEAYERFLVPAFFTRCAELVVAAAGINAHDRVLDVACGTGILARTVAPRIGAAGAGGTVTGSDVNEGMLQVARAVARDVAPEIRWVAADAAALPFDDASFDAVLCQQGAQFFTNLSGALREMSRVLTPRGVVVLAIWRPLEHNTIFVPLVEALGKHVGQEVATMMRAPFGGPPVASLRAKLTEAGLTKSSATIHSLPIRFPSVDVFFQREIASSPFSHLIAALSPSARSALIEDVRSRLSPWTDDAGLAFSLETWLVVAHKS